MAGFDTSNVAAQVTPPGNPLQTIEGFAGLQNTLNQNKLFQAKQLAGQYVGQATGPDGQVDPNKLVPLLQADKRTAFAIPEILQGVAALKGQGLTNQQTGLAVAGTQVDQLRKTAAIYGAAGVAKGDTAGATKDAHDAISKLVLSGAVMPEAAAAYMGSGDLTNDIRAAAIAGAGGDIVRQTIAPNIANIDTGGTIQGVAQNPVLGTQTSVGGNSASIPVTLTPAQKIVRNSGIDPTTGQPYSVPNAATATPTGDIKPNNGITGPQGQITTGLATGADIPKLGAAEQLKALQDTQASITNQESNVDELRTLARGVRTGPGSTQTADVIAAINRATGSTFDAGSSSQQILGKIQEQMAAANRGILGFLPTNEQANINRAASPNNQMGNAALDALAAQTKGNLDWIKAKNAAWTWADNKQFQTTGKHLNPGTDYLTVQARFNALHDPRYFQDKYMTPEQRTQMITGSMSPTELKKYNAGKQHSDNLVNGYNK
jgi:hypothetical protein